MHVEHGRMEARAKTSSPILLAMLRLPSRRGCVSVISFDERGENHVFLGAAVCAESPHRLHRTAPRGAQSVLKPQRVPLSTCDGHDQCIRLVDNTIMMRSPTARPTNGGIDC